MNGEGDMVRLKTKPYDYTTYTVITIASMQIHFFFVVLCTIS